MILWISEDEPASILNELTIFSLTILTFLFTFYSSLLIVDELTFLWVPVSACSILWSFEGYDYWSSFSFETDILALLLKVVFFWNTSSDIYPLFLYWVTTWLIARSNSNAKNGSSQACMHWTKQFIINHYESGAVICEIMDRFKSVDVSLVTCRIFESWASAKKWYNMVMWRNTITLTIITLTKYIMF